VRGAGSKDAVCTAGAAAEARGIELSSVRGAGGQAATSKLESPSVSAARIRAAEGDVELSTGQELGAVMRQSAVVLREALVMPFFGSRERQADTAGGGAGAGAAGAAGAGSAAPKEGADAGKGAGMWRVISLVGPERRLLLLAVGTTLVTTPATLFFPAAVGTLLDVSTVSPRARRAPAPAAHPRGAAAKSVPRGGRRDRRAPAPCTHRARSRARWSASLCCRESSCPSATPSSPSAASAWRPACGASRLLPPVLSGHAASLPRTNRTRRVPPPY